MVDSLFDVRNNYYLGAYQQCINEAQIVNCKTDEERLKKDYFLYRAYIALKKSSIPLSEINSNSGPELVALRRLAEYFNNGEKRSEIIRQVTSELEQVDSEGNEYVNLINATIFLQEDVRFFLEISKFQDAENALRFISRISDQTSLECLSMKIQCLLKLWRIDLALAELKKMQEVDEDATIVQLATAWVYMAMGKDKIKDAFYIFQEMVDKYGATPTLLVSQSSCLIQQQKYEDAEKLLMVFLFFKEDFLIGLTKRRPLNFRSCGGLPEEFQPRNDQFFKNIQIFQNIPIFKLFRVLVVCDLVFRELSGQGDSPTLSSHKFSSHTLSSHILTFEFFKDAQQRDPNNPEALIGLFVIAHFLGKPIEVSNRYMNQLKQDHPTHIWTKDFIAKEQEFDRLIFKGFRRLNKNFILMEEIVNKVVDKVCEEDADNEGKKIGEEGNKKPGEEEERFVEGGGEGRFEEVNGRQKEEEEKEEDGEEGEIFEEEEEEKKEDEEKLDEEEKVGEVKDGQKEEEEHNEEEEQNEEREDEEEECEEIEIKREDNVEDEKFVEEEKEEEDVENNLEIEEEEEETTDNVKEDDYSSRKSSSGERQSFKIMEFIDFDEIKKEHQDVEEIEEQKASTNLLTQTVPQATTNTLTQSNGGGTFNSSISQQRPKRNRARRLYTPSPPPRFGGESKRKRESDDSLASTSLQTSSNPKKISWAKEQPRQVHSANKPQQQQQPDNFTPHPPLPSQSSSSQQQNMDSTVPNSSSSLSSSSHFSSHPPPIVKFGHSIPQPMSKPPSTFGYSNQQSQMQTVQQAQHVVVLLRQNEKLAKEVASLKRLNQEQQQQIQSLISANRELIWAFNESRREHEELMKQLKTLMASNSNKNINNNSNGNVGQQQMGNTNFNVASNQNMQQQKQQPPVVPKMEVVVPRRILSKTITNTNKSSSDLQRSEKKLQQSNEISSYQPTVFALSKPKKSKVVDNKTTLRTSAKSQQKPPQKQQQQQKPKLLSNIPSSEQKSLVNLPSVEVKKEREDVGEIINRILPQNVEQKKRTKEEEIESIKEELNILKSNPDSSKFLGQRRPAFFTPKEFGDWHSVVSGDLRKQLVLKIFQALCPEVTQKCIDDYNKAYPSRVDYIKKSVNFSFETENDLFVNSKSKELYIGLIAEKIFTLREAISRFSTNTTTSGGGGGSSDTSNDERRNSSGNNNGNAKRKLADVLKRTTRSIGSNE
ncbi:unnamed protein product [Meloidogyne enterolobii]|uniref:Uncharacterized protein n=2 Tax=Meloidogyne enterolobii TaxID=390850 RepID=A0ACB1B8X5_MELEN